MRGLVYGEVIIHCFGGTFGVALLYLRVSLLVTYSSGTPPIIRQPSFVTTMDAIQTIFCLSRLTQLEYLRANIPTAAYSDDTTFFVEASKIIPQWNLSLATDWECQEGDKLGKWYATYESPTQYVITQWQFSDDGVVHGSKNQGDVPSFSCLTPGTQPADTPTPGVATKTQASYLRENLPGTDPLNGVVNAMYPGCAV